MKEKEEYEKQLVKKYAVAHTIVVIAIKSKKKVKSCKNK